MSAYQEIQLPQPQGLNGMAEFFQGLRKEQDQRRQDAWNHMIQQGVADRAQQELELRKQEQAARLERQRQADAEADQERLAKISEHLGSLHEAGLSHEASQLAQIYGLTQSVDQQPSGPRVGQLYDQQGLGDFAHQVTQAPGQTNLADQAPPEDHTVAAPVEGPNPPPAAPAAPAAPAGDLPATAPQYTEHPIYHYQGPGGVNLSFDPTERITAAQAQNKLRAEQFRAAFTAAPNMQPYADEFAARAQLGEDPKAIFADLSAREKADAAAKQKALGEPAHSAGRFEQEKELARIRAAAAAATTVPFKADAANQRDLNALRQGFESWKRTVQLPIDAKMYKRLANVEQNINSGNPMQQREAAESLVSVFKGGGQVTKASQDLLLKHLAGVVGDAQTFLEHLQTGRIGERELNVLKQAAKGAIDEQRELAQGYAQSAADTFGPGSGYENLAPNVNHMLGGAFRQFGIESPDIYPNAGPGVVLGSGTRPSKGTKQPQPSHEDRAALDWAHAHPNDPRAKAIRQANGER